MTKQELIDYHRMNVELKRLEDKMAELRHKAEKPRSSIISDMPKSGAGKNFTDYLDEIVELKEYYSKRAKEIIAKQNRIEHTISQLNDPIERAILSYRYTDALVWEMVLMKINYDADKTGRKYISWATMHRSHASALKNILKI